MLTRTTAITTAKKFITALKALGYNPLQAYLFGSVVNNKIHKYSDIDIAVWDKKFTGVMHQDIEKIKYLLLKYKYIELHPFAENTNESNNPFVKIIKQTGMSLNISNTNIKSTH